MLALRLKTLSRELPKYVHLLAVSKGQTTDSIRQLAVMGQRDFGESRLQEALPKIKELEEFKDIKWHFIGRLQSNKIRSVVRTFSVIHSLDSESLAIRLSRIAGEENQSPEVMVQVKFRDDPSKGGFDPVDLVDAWPRLIQLSNLKLIGLMTMAPMQISSYERKELFRDCRKLADSLGLKHCSMGMTSDWKEAVEVGATWIRLGSALFEGL